MGLAFSCAAEEATPGFGGGVRCCGALSRRRRRRRLDSLEMSHQTCQEISDVVKTQELRYGINGWPVTRLSGTNATGEREVGGEGVMGERVSEDAGVAFSVCFFFGFFPGASFS